MAGGRNIVEKIWSEHVVEEREGYPDILYIDLHLLHEVTSPQAFQELKKRSLTVFAPDRCLATLDHVVPTGRSAGREPSDAAGREMVQALRGNAKAHGIRLMDMGGGRQGIVHVIAPELGLSQPGMTIVCGDSHTSTHGALGALAFGIGTSEVANVLATGCLLRPGPKVMKIRFIGEPGPYVGSKDIALKMIHTLGVGGAAGYVIEYAGEAVAAMSMEERMTLCNMSIECGARAGLVAPDATTLDYLRSRPASPREERWDEAREYWLSLRSDAGAAYDRTASVNISGLAPMVTWGTNPAQAAEVTSCVPDPSAMEEEQQAESAHRALDYVKLRPGTPLTDVPIDYVFIGSCTNGRISDLRQAAQILRGRKVARGVRVLIVPGSEVVAKQAIDEGLVTVFLQSGAEFGHPGCSMCLAMNGDTVPTGKRCASTSNRNFVGRQGIGAITHLMSPATAAASAITGRITDPRTLI
jgi:3-isopropylmalate/(R)-2-methylmalate dehydratase large subunit